MVCCNPLNSAVIAPPVLGLLALLALTPLAAAAAPASHPVFGDGAPQDVAELPAGQLRERLETLPAPARNNALKWLQDLDFPAADAAFMSADEDGGIYYVDQAPVQSAGAATDPVPAQEGLTATQAFTLHSKPGAPNTLFLDFDGDVIQGTAWNGGSTADTLYARPYDTDGDPTTFSASELDAIHEVWHRVAEDFAAFDVNVTTEDPLTFGPSTGHVLITRDEDELGNAMPHAGAGGVAYVGVFGRSNYTSYQPALVYFDNLGNGHPPYVAEASSHEFGHNLNLSHDGTSTTSYFQGIGDTSSYVSWAPIMGVGYYRQVTQWSNGEYADANNLQDDIAIIESQLGRRSDDHGDDIFSASVLVVDSAGGISHSNPEADPWNQQPENKGVLNEIGDTDVFGLAVGAGTLDITITPAWDAFTRNVRRGANLDIEAQLLDSSGAAIATADYLDDTSARIQANVEAGDYYLAVRGVGNTTVPYTDYASQGMYFISGQVVAGEPNTPPTATADSASTAEDVSVTVAVLVNDTDPDGDALSILSVSAPGNGNAAINGTSVTYTPAANFAGTDSFTYGVGDGRGGFDSASVTVTVTGSNDAPTAANDAASTVAATAVTIAVLANDSDVDGDAMSVVSVANPGNGSATHDGARVQYTPAAGFSGTDTFSYTITDGELTASATISVTVAAPVPTTPVGLSASDDTNGTALLNWADSSYETSYEVERQSLHKKRGTWVGGSIVATPTADTTSLNDASGTGTFRYRIRALGTGGTSSWSNWADVTVSDSSGGGGRNGGGKGKNK